MRYIVAIEIGPGQYESHIFDSELHFCAWYSAQNPKPGPAMNRAAVTMRTGGQAVPEVDHRMTRVPAASVEV